MINHGVIDFSTWYNSTAGETVFDEKSLFYTYLFWYGNIGDKYISMWEWCHRDINIA